MMPYNTKEKQYRQQAIHRDRNKNLMQQYLLTHPCIDCGEADPVVLDFDHVGEKRFTISHAVYGSTRSWKLILSEIEQCEVRCANCHRRRHASTRNRT